MLAALAIAVCGVVVARCRFTVNGDSQFTLVDDAMISMRYARYLASGDGLVWNLGDPPIEGFSNLGYTLLMAPGFLFGNTLFSRYLPICITIAGFVASTLLTAALTRQICPRSITAPLAAGAMVALDFGLVFWTARGMEVSLVIAAILAMTLQLIRWRHTRITRCLWFGAALGAAAIVVRMDSLAPVLVIAVWLLICEFVNHRSVRESLVVAAVAVGTTVALIAFQASYFGDALPNTYRLKMEGASIAERAAVGWQVFLENAKPQLLVLLLLGIVLLALCSPMTMLNGDALVLVALAAVSISYSLWVGGDYAEPQVHAPNRFILVGIPGLCVLAAAGAAAAGAAVRPLVRTAAVGPVLGILAVAAVLQPNYENLRSLWSGEIPLLDYDEQRTALGLHLRATLPPEATIATHTAGQIPFYSQLRTIDLLGKSDKTIASLPQTSDRFRPGHNKWDYDYGINELAPDVVADEWGPVRSYLQKHGGYTRLPNGLWLSNTPRVPIDIQALGTCYWQCKP